MIKLVAVAFLVALASLAQAMPRAAIEQPDSLVTTVREACGAGMHRVNGVCVRAPARRQAARALRLDALIELRGSVPRDCDGTGATLVDAGNGLGRRRSP
jgi:hypothetical protein